MESLKFRKDLEKPGSRECKKQRKPQKGLRFKKNWASQTPFKEPSKTGKIEKNAASNSRLKSQEINKNKEIQFEITRKVGNSGNRSKLSNYGILQKSGNCLENLSQKIFHVECLIKKTLVLFPLTVKILSPDREILFAISPENPTTARR